MGGRARVNNNCCISGKRNHCWSGKRPRSTDEVDSGWTNQPPHGLVPNASAWALDMVSLRVEPQRQLAPAESISLCRRWQSGLPLHGEHSKLRLDSHLHRRLWPVRRASSMVAAVRAALAPGIAAPRGGGHPPRGGGRRGGHCRGRSPWAVGRGRGGRGRGRAAKWCVQARRGDHGNWL